MVTVNLEAKQMFERHLIEPDAYIGTIVAISDVYSQKGFEEKIVEKLRVEIELDGKKIKLPYFLTATVSHASKQAGYSDSKLYSMLDLAKELDNFKKMWSTVADNQDKNQIVVDWLRSQLLSRKVKVMVKTVNAFDGTNYSVVGQIVKFEN